MKLKPLLLPILMVICPRIFVTDKFWKMWNFTNLDFANSSKIWKLKNHLHTFFKWLCEKKSVILYISLSIWIFAEPKIVKIASVDFNDNFGNAKIQIYLIWKSSFGRNVKQWLYLARKLLLFLYKQNCLYHKMILLVDNFNFTRKREEIMKMLQLSWQLWFHKKNWKKSQNT